MKYNELKKYIESEYPTYNVFANDKRFVIEENQKEILTYYPDVIVASNLKKIPNTLELINDYDLLRTIDG